MRAKELSMFRIQSALFQPAHRSAQRSRKSAGHGRFRSDQDFSVRAYERLDAIRSRAFVSNAFRVLGRIAGAFMRHVLDAMYQSRREEALRVLGRHDWLAFRTDSASQAVYGMRVRCSITGAPCEGDRAHLCVEWGCARKAGLSPISHENA
jgi:hypothetical protein